MPPWGSRSRVFAALLVLALPPAVLAVVQLGRIHPDEVFQFLEPALFRARGYGILAWEWRVGLRNWAVPLLFAQLLRASDALGLQNPRAYRAVLELPQFALHFWSLGAFLQYARRRVPEVWAWAAVALVAFYGLTLVFAGRTLGESFSASFLLMALEAADRPGRPFRAGLVLGGALGLAVVVRYGSAVAVLAFVSWLLARRQWGKLAGCCLAGGLAALALGALDAVTWGSAFHSLREYVRFNVLSSGAAQQFGSSPAGFYLPLVATLAPLWALPAAGYLGWRRRELPLGLFVGGVYLLAISLTPHKEPRFLYPALVLWTGEGAVGAVAALERTLRAGAARWMGFAVLVGLGLAPYLQLPPQRPDQFRAIVRATRDAGATGFLLVNEGVWGSGGYFYIGKSIPFALADEASEPRFQQAVAAGVINRAVTYDDRALPQLLAAGFRVQGRDGEATWLAR